MKQLGRKIIVFLLAFLITNATGFAQGKRAEKIQALKVAYITEKVKLTSSQAEQFWPVYHRYEEDLRHLRLDFLKRYKNQTRNFSEEEARRYVDDNLDYQDELVDLKRRYKAEFLKTISAQQLTALYAAEREFRQMLIQKLRERRRRR